MINDFEKNKLVREKIKDFQREYKIEIPKFLINFYVQNNGISFENGDICIFSIDELYDMNLYYEANAFVPNYLVFGSTCGGKILVTKQEKNNCKVLLCESGVMNIEVAEIIVVSDFNWIDNITNTNNKSDKLSVIPDTCSVQITSKLNLNELLLIKKTLNISLPSKDLLELSKNVPFNIDLNFTKSKANVLLDKYLSSIKEKIVIK